MTYIPNPGQSAPAAAHDFEGLAGQALKIAFIINVVAPAILFGVCVALCETGMLPSAAVVPYETLSLIFFILLFVAATELGAAFFIRRTLFEPAKIRPVINDATAFAKMVQANAIVLAALGASMMIYGVVLYALGTDLTRVAVFALLALICFRLLRPSADFLRSAVDRASH